MSTWYKSPRDAQGDAVWQRAVDAGHVGPRCRLPGPYIEGLLATSPNDGCAVCPVSERTRHECEGRPAKAPIVLDPKKSVAIGSEFSNGNLKMVRAMRIRELQGPFGKKDSP